MGFMSCHFQMTGQAKWAPLLPPKTMPACLLKNEKWEGFWGPLDTTVEQQGINSPCPSSHLALPAAKAQWKSHPVILSAGLSSAVLQGLL